jgi:hypothetical protein
MIADCLADGAYSAKHIAPVEHKYGIACMFFAYFFCQPGLAVYCFLTCCSTGRLGGQSCFVSSDLFPEADAPENDFSGGTLPRHPQQTMFYPKQQQDMQRHSDSPAHRNGGNGGGANGGGGAYSPVDERHESRLFPDGPSPAKSLSATPTGGVRAHGSAASGGRVSVPRWNSQASAEGKAALGAPSRR